MCPIKCRLVDETGFLTLIFFRADPRWMKKQLPEGAMRIVSGRVEDFQGGQANRPSGLYAGS